MVFDFAAIIDSSCVFESELTNAPETSSTATAPPALSTLFARTLPDRSLAMVIPSRVSTRTHSCFPLEKLFGFRRSEPSDLFQSGIQWYSKRPHRQRQRCHTWGVRPSRENHVTRLQLRGVAKSALQGSSLFQEYHLFHGNVRLFSGYFGNEAVEVNSARKSCGSEGFFKVSSFFFFIDKSNNLPSPQVINLQ